MLYFAFALPRGHYHFYRLDTSWKAFLQRRFQPMCLRLWRFQVTVSDSAPFWVWKNPYFLCYLSFVATFQIPGHFSSRLVSSQSWRCLEVRQFGQAAQYYNSRFAT